MSDRSGSAPHKVFPRSLALNRSCPKPRYVSITKDSCTRRWLPEPSIETASALMLLRTRCTAVRSHRSPCSSLLVAHPWTTLLLSWGKPFAALFRGVLKHQNRDTKGLVLGMAGCPTLLYEHRSLLTNPGNSTTRIGRPDQDCQESPLSNPGDQSSPGQLALPGPNI